MIISGRRDWGARAPKRALLYVAPARRKYFVVHHSGGPVDQPVRTIQDWCIDSRGFNDIDYNFLVRGDTGQIYEGRGWDAIGSHTTGFNTPAVGVCVIGNDQISDAAKRSVRWLYDRYTERCGHPLIIRGHRQLATTGTECPGSKISAWLAAGMTLPRGSEVGDMDKTELLEVLNSPEGQEAIARAAGRGVHGQLIGKSKTSIGVALETILSAVRKLTASE